MRFRSKSVNPNLAIQKWQIYIDIYWALFETMKIINNLKVFNTILAKELLYAILWNILQLLNRIKQFICEPKKKMCDYKLQQLVFRCGTQVLVRSTRIAACIIIIVHLINIHFWSTFFE